MPLIIACLSQKGGVGKSTLSRLVARTYANAGWRVKIADFNVKQKTSVDWAAMRMASGLEPEIAAEAFNSVRTAAGQDYDLIVCDGRPDSDTSTLDCAKIANLVVIPTGVTLDDLKPQVVFAHELTARSVSRSKLLFVLNKSTESAIAVADARNYLESAGYVVAETDLPIKTGYQIAQNSGRAVSETLFSTLNERANQLAEEIVDTATKFMRPAA